MAGEQSKPVETATAKIPKHRSPNYPFIGLEDAIERSRKLYETGRGHYVPVTTARDAWGYQRNAGDRTVAALKAYGLIEVKGEGEKRELKPTEASSKILEHHSTRDELLKEAVLKPELHRELWEKYSGNLPGDPVIREFLRWEKKFNPENVDKFIQQFRETIAFANLTEADKIESGSNASISSTGGQEQTQTRTLTGQVKPPPFIPTNSTRRVDLPNIGDDVLSFNLSRTGKARVRFNGTVTQEAIRKLIALLELSVDTYPTQAELIQPKQAVWLNKDHDQPVTVTGELGEQNGKRYFSIAESNSGIPEDELDFEGGDGHGI